jgi:hypothetical protein
MSDTSAFSVNGSTGVTSVGVSSSTGLQVASSPITTTGTITVDIPNSVCGRNLLVNGNFGQFNWAPSPVSVAASTAASYLGPDRWQFLTNANQACTITAGAGGTAGFSASFQRNSAQTGTGIIYLSQTVLRAQCSYFGIVGNYVTCSFTATAGANWSPTSGAFTATITSGTGSTDVSSLSTGFTGSATYATSTVDLTTTATRYTLTGSGVIGASVTQLAVTFSWTPAGTASTADTVTITNVQLEVSPTATPFEAEHTYVTAFKCRAYYQKSFSTATAAAQNTGTYIGVVCYRAEVASTTAGYSIYFPLTVPMRSTPTVTFYSPGDSTAKWYNKTGSADSGTAAIDSAVATVNSNLCINNPQVAGDAAGNALTVHFQCNSEVT